MNRRDMIKAGVGGMLGSLLIGSKTEAKDVSKHAGEERTYEYLSSLSEWDEQTISDDESNMIEYLFTCGYEKKSLLDVAVEDVGYAFVYTPVHRGGHIFDLIIVKIGKKNISKDPGLFKK